MTLPINTSQLLEYIPHRPPMVWIDEILEFSENGGIGTTVIKDNAHYLTDNHLRKSTCIEFIAQTFAFNNAAYLKNLNAHNEQNTPPLKRAFLAAIKDFKIHQWVEVKTGDVLTTTVKKDRQFGPITLIHGETSLNGVLLASCEMKVFAD